MGDRKASELGMPFGTASNRLRKMILFRFSQMLGKDICFRCGRRIDKVDDLSIEHKRPWLGVDVALFWDLDNVAFSHLRCNRPDPERHAVACGRKVGPPGTRWCWMCKTFTSDFSPKWRSCKSCDRIRVKSYEDRNRERTRTRKREYMRRVAGSPNGMAAGRYPDTVVGSTPTPAAKRGRVDGG